MWIAEFSLPSAIEKIMHFKILGICPYDSQNQQILTLIYCPSRDDDMDIGLGSFALATFLIFWALVTSGYLLGPKG